MKILLNHRCSYLQVVELVLVGQDAFGADHPMHIHGYNVRVVGMGKLVNGTTLDDVILMDEQGTLAIMVIVGDNV